MQSDGSTPTENDDPTDELRQRFAELEAKRTGKPTFAEVMRQTVHRPQTPDGPRTTALNAFLKSVTGTPFERPIWDEYHRRKWLDDDTLAAAAGIARAEGLEDPDCCGLWEVWAGFLLPKLERFAGTVPGWNGRHGAPLPKEKWPTDDNARQAIIRLRENPELQNDVTNFCRQFTAELNVPDTAAALRKMLYLPQYKKLWHREKEDRATRAPHSQSPVEFTTRQGSFSWFNSISPATGTTHQNSSQKEKTE